MKTTLHDYPIDHIALTKLLLDPGNPRLSVSQREANLKQPELMKLLHAEFELDELGESFIENGFFGNEPLLAVKENTGYRVHEGNRRLAALKLIVDGPEVHKIKSQKFEELHAVFQKLPSAQKGSLDHPTVCIVPDDAAIAGYIGFRHVTGIKPWPALEKAAYIASLIEKHKLNPKEIAKLIGSKPLYVARHYHAYRMIMQARDEEIADTSEIEENFGVMMRALQAQGVLEFLGVIPPTADGVKANPLATKTSRERFAEFVEWAFGTADKQPLFTDSRRLTDFAHILRSKRALDYVRSASAPDFEEAYHLSGGEDVEALKAVRTAEFALRDALPAARSLKGDKEFAASVDRCSDYLSQILVYFSTVRLHYFAAIESK